MKQVSRIPSIAFLLLGVLCILFPVHIAGVLPFLLGGIMLVAGVMHGGAYLRNQRFLEGESRDSVRMLFWWSWAWHSCVRVPRP